MCRRDILTDAPTAFEEDNDDIIELPVVVSIVGSASLVVVGIALLIGRERRGIKRLKGELTSIEEFEKDFFKSKKKQSRSGSKKPEKQNSIGKDSLEFSL